ncbi:allatostatin-A receptor-like isoform X4 [Saccostrea cucullata]|uniref:allatostatin-A receptor-like isoform X4 n=1 Tax=Saccostrea cuccullata TaxID=36930 RepID=UPI002ECFAEFB
MDAQINTTDSQALNGTSADESAMLFESLVRIIIPTIFGLIVFLGLVGNLLVIIVVYSYKQMQNTTNILIVSLAFADLFFIIFCVPFTATLYAMPTWPFGDIWCKIVNYLMYVCAYASVWTLVLMSFDRYLAVVHPISSMRLRNTRNAYILIVLTWFIFSVGHIRLLIQYNVLEYNYSGAMRSSCINIEEDTLPLFHACFFAFGYVLPLLIICVLYGFLLKRLLYGVVPGGSQRAENIRSKKRVTRMIIIVVVIFALCWLPIHICFMIQYFDLNYETNIVNTSFLMTANCIAYMNSCMNPILYAFLSENFRRSFKKLLCCKRERWNKFEYERTQARGHEKENKDTKDTLLNNATKCTEVNSKELLLNNTTKITENGKDSNCNSENALEMKTIKNL